MTTLGRTGFNGFRVVKTSKTGDHCKLVVSIRSDIDPEDLATVMAQYVATLLAAGKGGVLVYHSCQDISRNKWPDRIVVSGSIFVSSPRKHTGRTSVVFSTPEGEMLGSCDLGVIRLPPRVGR